MAVQQHMDHVQTASTINMNTAKRDAAAPGRLQAGRVRPLVLVVASLALVGYIDRVTGYEVSVFLLYAVPVAMATRWLGTAAGLLTAMAATGVWVWADVASGHTYSKAWILYVNAFNRMVFFVLTVAAIRYMVGRHRSLLRRLSAFTGTQPVCTQCHHVAGHDGYWRSFEDHLAEFGGATIQHKVCPDCARRGYARAAYRGDAIEQAS
jgi:hypothetical protein